MVGPLSPSRPPTVSHSPESWKSSLALVPTSDIFFMTKCFASWRIYSVKKNYFTSGIYTNNYTDPTLLPTMRFLSNFYYWLRTPSWPLKCLLPGSPVTFSVTSSVVGAPFHQVCPSADRSCCGTLRIPPPVQTVESKHCEFSLAFTQSGDSSLLELS